ncbi:hybrid-cluster NAD(P)-dependent oxidoreductase [Labrys monachus]|uniref:Ferredoxin-NADP reductase n=1 Tax=Labrys monachus TaxID=217067 RepID=A0ABU0FJ00_9HYPH|nr:hybrid-cluster NAD(P)-dependent oxidoreductase [Labrys monachus]MDQ0394053.1 ferredoxin-NADP reductase [Labrys monachus]
MATQTLYRHLDEARPWSDRAGQLECVAVMHEGRDVATFTFRAPDDSWFRYEPGQFVTLELPTAEGPVLRTYTLSSSPSRPLSISVTAKAQATSVGTRWMLENLKPGTRLKAHGPAGQFTFHRHPAERYLFISAGSGITPMMSMTRFAEDHGSAVDIAFVNCARRPSDIIFRHELERMAGRMRHLRLAWIVEESDPGEAWTGFRGRLNAPALRLIAPDFREREIFCCGPAPFMAAVKDMLEANGCDMRRYHEESFHPPEPDALAAGGEPADGAAQGSVAFVQSGIEVPATGGETILQLARSAGLNIPTGCTMGLCGTCKVQRLSGDVAMAHQGGIREEEIDAGLILACCSRPLGRVEIEA